MTVKQKKILHQQIEELPFTSELKYILNKASHKTLHDVLNVEVYKWHEYLPFTYHHQHEIVSYVIEHKLLDYVKED